MTRIGSRRASIITSASPWAKIDTTDRGCEQFHSFKYPSADTLANMLGRRFANLAAYTSFVWSAYVCSDDT